jgi:hypothetical protein
MGGSAYEGPDFTMVDAISAKVHEATKLVLEGATKMPYDQLTDDEKTVIREGVKVTILTIEAAGYVVSKKPAADAVEKGA